MEPVQVLVMADGASDSEVSNRRGHVFEQFIAQLLTHYGYSHPTTEDLNVLIDGIELDVTATHDLTGEALIAECKAYTANVSADVLDQFLGKYSFARAEDPDLHGFLIVLPRLTGHGVTRAAKVQQRFPKFKVLYAGDVATKLREKHLLPPDPNDGLLADPAVIVTEHGVAMAYKELDPESRGAAGVRLIYAGGAPPEPLTALVEQSPYADGLHVRSETPAPRSFPLPTSRGESPDVVPVHGSSDDFEYQFPASPRYFIGRQHTVKQLVELATASTRGRVMVLNAKSGWGKSSTALRVAQRVTKARGHALVLDSRTAGHPDYVTAALRALAHGAEDAGILALPDDPAFASRSSALATLARSEWSEGRAAVLFFDQFENVFRDTELTREFKDLALSTLELPVPLIVGFAWKTDLVGWTEGHPYQLRDAIRQSADVTVLEPWGPKEIETLLRRLEKRLGEKLETELRRRLREYSQGLPWLLKKLAGHIIREVVDGEATQEQLLAQDLNVQTLFESDLGELLPAEQQALRTIARRAPVVISELEEVVPSEVLQSLLDRRLVVQISERVDIYWDIFRDFLTTGRVAIEDSYVVRYSPQAVGRLFNAVIAAGGSLTVAEAARQLDTSTTVIFNLARDLRLVGLIVVAPNRMELAEVVKGADDYEAAARSQAARALRRHKIHSLVTELFGRSSESLSMSRLASEMPDAFPAVEAKPSSWENYGRAFSRWLDYAGLAVLDPQGVLRAIDSADSNESPPVLTATPRRRPLRGVFPQASATAAEKLLLHLSGNGPAPSAALRGPIRDLEVLGAVSSQSTLRAVYPYSDRMSLETGGSVSPLFVNSSNPAREVMTCSFAYRPSPGCHRNGLERFSPQPMTLNGRRAPQWA